MTNEVANVFGNTALADKEAIARRMQEMATFGARGQDGVSYGSFSGKLGKYSFGTEQREPDPEEPFLVNPTAFKVGFICWKNGRPLDKRMAGPDEPPVIRPDPDEGGPFHDTKDGWKDARQIMMKSLENEEQVEFTVNSKSAVSVFQELHKKVFEQFTANDGEWMFPIVKLSSEKFPAKGNVNFKPTITVVKWLTGDQVAKWAKEGFDPMSWLDDDDAGGEEEEEITPRRRRRL